jgi:S1-C subfamily serine protease
MRNIPDDNLAYPVLVQIGNSSGSGFLFSTLTDHYFVTAKHVLFDNNNFRGPSATLVCPSKAIDDDSTTNYLVDLNVLQSENNVYRHLTKDVCALRIASISQVIGTDIHLNRVNGVTEPQSGSSPTVSVGFDSVLFINEVLISNDVYLYGYPTSLGLNQSPQFDFSKPLLRKGIVANVYKSLGTIILDCPVYYGNSGGPVVQISQEGPIFKHNVIGVVSQFIPYTENWKNQSNNITHIEISNSGYSVAVAMDFVFEILGINVAHAVSIPPTSNPTTTSTSS